jgi:hypothetical protein
MLPVRVRLIPQLDEHVVVALLEDAPVLVGEVVLPVASFPFAVVAFLVFLPLLAPAR